MEKRLIATRSDINIKEMSDLTHPFIKQFADKWKADFLVLDHKPPIMTDDGNYHFRIMKFRELFEEYDRILSLDTDIIITPNCPNIFDIVHNNSIGTILEDVGSRMIHRKRVIERIQKQFGDIGWSKGYVNTGVFMVSKCHKEIFEPIAGKYYTAWGSDDAHLGYQINRLHLNIQELFYQYNHMTMYSEDWFGNADRFKSNIIHYAGVGIFDKRKHHTKIEQIKEDITILYR